MPAEWEPHHGTWFSWPRRDGMSFPGRYDAVPPVYATLIRHLVDHEEVNINVWDEAMAEEVTRYLIAQKVPMLRVHLHPFPAYEPWCRDHGPIFLVRDQFGGPRERAVIDWGYNAWGGKYPPYDLDDQVPQHIARLRGLRLFSPSMILEGGSIDVNGCGTLLTTESCLLHPNRNPTLSQSEISAVLREHLGVRKIIWLGEGIVGDDTDGHVDDLARFINPTTIVTVVEENIDDANYQPLQENLRRLRMERDQSDHLFRIIKLPMPRMIESQGQRLPASYANFYIANGIVLVPTFRDPNDRIALETLQKAMPDRRVMGVDSTDLIWGLGSFHCISQQEPA